MTEQTTLFIIFWIVAYVLIIVVSLLILWAIVRGAVLSALRKHHSETQGRPTA
jgi:flagellar biosynthesis/type III secretory pathway M-ring protein FliF/YscJ